MVAFRALGYIITILLLFTYCSAEFNERDTSSVVHYGVHQVKACSEFEKAFLCIQKCLDLNFDMASADKKCKCTCYHKRDLAQYTIKRGYNTTNWKLGVPTTDLPPWKKNLVAKVVTPRSEETYSPEHASKEYYIEN